MANPLPGGTLGVARADATVSGVATITGGTVVTAPQWDYPSGGGAVLAPLHDVAALMTVTPTVTIRDGATGSVTVIG